MTNLDDRGLSLYVRASVSKQRAITGIALRRICIFHMARSVGFMASGERASKCIPSQKIKTSGLEAAANQSHGK